MTTKTLTPASQPLAFKRFFHAGDPAWFQLVPEPEDTSPGKPRSMFGHWKTRKDALLAANRKGAGVFMAVNTISGDRRCNANVTGINAVFIDVDGSMTLNDIKALRPVPHLVVRSSKRRYHVYWKVSDLPVAQFKVVQRALAARFGADQNVTDAARVMRVPGTLHRKGKPVLAEIVRIKADAKPLTVAELASGLELDIEDEKPVEQVEENSGFVAGETTEAEIRSALFAIPVAHDYETWLKNGMAVHSAMPDERGRAMFEEWSRQSPAFTEAGQRKAWNSFKSEGGITKRRLFALARKHGWQAAAGALPHDEFGLIDEFAKRVRDQLCFEEGSKRWMVFDPPTWRMDDARAAGAARRVVEGLLAEAKAQGDTVAQQLLKRHANIVGVRNLLRDAACSSSLVVKREAFDAQPHLLAVANGVVDLPTGVFRAGAPDDRLLRCAPTAFDAGATCPHFETFIRFVTRDDAEFAAYLQRALGYTLFGHADEHVFFVVFGPTRNGKGTLFRTMAHVLGEFVSVVAPNLLSKAYAGNPQGPSPAMMALQGPRMYQCGEGEERHRFDTAFIKQLSGGDAMTGRGNFQGQQQFTPTGKLWLSANHLPEVPAQDEAMWQRYLLLPFKAQIESRDKHYEDRLKAEAAGILNWLLEGAKAYQAQGLGSCSAVNKATRWARGAGDYVGKWIKECCDQGESLRLQSSAAYEAYRKFCRQHDVKPLTVQQFSHALPDKGFAKQNSKKANFFRGLALRE